MSVLCKIFGHSFVPYRHNWVEFMPTQMRTNVNRDGSYIISHVYCKRCGVVREVINPTGSNVKYREPKSKKTLG